MCMYVCVVCMRNVAVVLVFAKSIIVWLCCVWVFVMCSVACLFILIFVCSYIYTYMHVHIVQPSVVYVSLLTSVVYFSRFCLILFWFFHFHEYHKAHVTIGSCYDWERCLNRYYEPWEWLSVEHTQLYCLLCTRTIKQRSICFSYEKPVCVHL